MCGEAKKLQTCFQLSKHCKILLHFIFRFLSKLFFIQRWKGNVATIQEDENSHLFGVVWEMNMEHLETLDNQEGVESGIYKRINVKVKTFFKWNLRDS